MKRYRSYTIALFVALIYLSFGLLWIYFSDKIALKIWFNDPETLSKMQTEKGFIFVFSSASLIGILIYLLNKKINRFGRRLEIQHKQIQDELTQKNLLFNSTSDLIWLFDKDRKLISFNESFSNFIRKNFNIEPTVGGETFLNVIDAQTIQKWANYYDKALSGESFQITNSSTLMNGDKIFLECSFHPVTKGNRIHSVSVFARDITPWVETNKKKNQAIADLESQSEFITTTLDNLPIGIAVNNTKSNKLVYVNKEFKQIYGWDSFELKRSDECYKLIYSNNKELSEVFNKKLEEVNFQDLSALKSTITEFTKNGEETKLIDTVNIPLKSHSIVVTTLRDVTDEKKKAAELRESKTYFNTLSSQASDAIVSCDSEGKTFYYNKKFKSLFNAKEKIDLANWPQTYGMYSLYANRLLHPSEVCLSIALKKGYLKNHRYRLINGQSEKILEANGAALVDKTGITHGAMVVIRDITERVQIEMKQTAHILEAVDKERTLIARNIHDSLTQQLATIYLNLNSLEQTQGLTKQDQNRLNQSILYLKETINESRELSHNLIPESIKDYGLHEALKGLVSRINLNNKVNVVLNYKMKGRFASDIELHLYRIIQQASMNALTHSKCSEIVLDIDQNDSSTDVSIKDNGIGISTNTVDKQGIGILSMRNRAYTIGAYFNILSSPNEGTSVVVSVPKQLLIENEQQKQMQ